MPDNLMGETKYQANIFGYKLHFCIFRNRYQN